MYRLDRMRKDYYRFTGADSYALGFIENGKVYVAYVDFLPRRFTYVRRECSRIGGYGLYINCNKKKVKMELLKKAQVIGTIEDLLDEKYNKGVMFEKLIYESNGQTFRGKDNVRFTEGGDIVINGRQVQVKFGNARICLDKTLKKLKKTSISC